MAGKLAAVNQEPDSGVTAVTFCGRGTFDAATFFPHFSRPNLVTGIRDRAESLVDFAGLKMGSNFCHELTA